MCCQIFVPDLVPSILNRPNCSSFCKMGPFSFLKNHIFSCFSQSILVIQTKLCRDIARGKRHLGREFNLKQPWHQAMEAIFRVWNCILNLHFFRTNKPQNDMKLVLFNKICNFYKYSSFVKFFLKNYIFTLFSKSTLVIQRKFIGVRGTLSGNLSSNDLDLVKLHFCTFSG